TTGFSDTIRIRIFTYSDRKIADFTKNNYPSGKNTIEYNPDKNLGNGLYYYVIEVTGRSRETIKKTGIFVVLNNLIY
ncbi:MAG TPA: hypothetical protein PLF61_02090, partial [Candidatus Goldiibacteriota bacterium]|nr:hypothetical protein [Candidatus Goldiibacteriota bacterium]